MFEAIIIKNDGTELTFNSPKDFMTFWYDSCHKTQNLSTLGDIAAMIYSGMISNLPEATKLFKSNTNIATLQFKCFKISEQHKMPTIYCLTREAAQNIFAMAGIKEARSLAGATYYHDGLAWETRATTLEI